MANWCNNQIYFTGEESKVKEVKSLFIEMQKLCNQTNEGQKPFFIKEVVKDYFFDIYAYDDDDEQISFSTKWDANTEDCILIAKHYGLNFELNYQEPSNNIYGKAIYTAGKEAMNYNLSDKYFDMYEFDDENDIYKYEGEEYECEEDILEKLFNLEFNKDY
jgi:hypothetical protein